MRARTSRGPRSRPSRSPRTPASPPTFAACFKWSACAPSTKRWRAPSSNSASSGARSHASRVALREILADEIRHARIGWAYLASPGVRAGTHREVERWLSPMICAQLAGWSAADRDLARGRRRGARMSVGWRHRRDRGGIAECARTAGVRRRRYRRDGGSAVHCGRGALLGLREPVSSPQRRDAAERLMAALGSDGTCRWMRGFKGTAIPSLAADGVGANALAGIAEGAVQDSVGPLSGSGTILNAAAPARRAAPAGQALEWERRRIAKIQTC